LSSIGADLKGGDTTSDQQAGPVLRVAVVDGQPVYRAGLIEAIRQQPELECVFDAGDGLGGIERILGSAPDVAVVGVNLPGSEDLPVLESIAQSEGGTRVLVLASREAGPLIYQALAAGASGYLMKDADAETICSAIAAVARGDTVVSPELLGVVARHIRADNGRSTVTLTQRQHDILRLTADGLSAERVGRELSLSSSTVKTHLAHIYEKLGVSGAPAAVCEAMRRGILS
jgi:two-component system, NarL family, nitrate/nitrite response regulator NarL